MKQALLDTDTISYFFRGMPSVVQKVDKYLKNHGFVSISVVTYYEVMNGLLYKDAKMQLKRFEEFVQLHQVVPLTQETARKAAEIFANLKKKGKAIGHNDVLLAGTALLHNMVLVTNNTKHFSNVKGLEIDNWMEL